MAADLERDATGRPVLMMIDIGSSGSLMFTARWAASASDVEALRSEIASRVGVHDRGEVRLSFAPVESPRCDVSFRKNDGVDRQVATSRTSGYPPYSAVFNLRLEGDDLIAAKAAIGGRRNVLRVEYTADLPSPISATARFQSTADDLMPWLRSRPAGEGLRASLDEAIRSGRAEVLVNTSAEGDRELIDELRARAVDRAEQLLPRWLDGYETGEIRIEVALERIAYEPVRASGDIGEISAGGR